MVASPMVASPMVDSPMVDSPMVDSPMVDSPYLNTVPFRLITPSLVSLLSKHSIIYTSVDKSAKIYMKLIGRSVALSGMADAVFPQFLSLMWV